LLFILYTGDCRSKYENRHCVKFADDTVIVSLLHNDEDVVDFIAWCETFYLSINVSKTKDMIIDFRRLQHNVSQIVIQNLNVETVDEYKYLETIIDRKLSFEIKTVGSPKGPTETFLLEEDEDIQRM